MYDLAEANAFLQAVRDKCARKFNKYGHPASLHECVGLIEEEVDEFKEVVWRKPSKRDPSLLYDECVDIAAEAMRTKLAFPKLCDRCTELAAEAMRAAMAFGAGVK